MLNLYQEILMDHYKNPRNCGIIPNASFYTEQHNSSCGDEVYCSGIINDKKLSSINFNGKGCVISQATASLLSEQVQGISIAEIIKLDANYLTSLIKMPLGPVRMQCALLPLLALQRGINKTTMSFY